MIDQLKKKQRIWLLSLIVICLGVLMAGGVYYIRTLRSNLYEQAVRNVLAVTKQQEQAFDSFLASDRERIHSFAQYFSRNVHGSPQEMREQLTLFNEVDAVYSIICLDEGWFCSSKTAEIRQLSQESLDFYRTFSGSGVRSSYIGIFSGDPKFGYYETFTFADGDRGLMQKSYDRTKVSAEFSLSFYEERGLSYVINQDGDILMRSNELIGNQLYENIFDLVTGANGEQENLDSFRQALKDRQTGSMEFTGPQGAYVYTYVPLKNGEDWYLVSIVPTAAITEEADRILINSQLAVAFMAIVLVICAVFIVLMWRTRRDMEAKDRTIEYQERMFDILSTYLSNNTNDVYMMVDAQTGTMEYVSPNVERVLGVMPEELYASPTALGRPLQTKGSGMDYYYMMRNMEPGVLMENLETERINRQTGEHKWFRENIYCTLVQDRRKMIIYISDRTEERETQDALTEALHMAQAANEAKSSFLSSVSHDIRTPMNAIIGFTTLLKDNENIPETEMDYIQRIDAASQHLLGLINDVLDMNKIESGSTTLNLSEVNMADIIEEINTIIRPQTRMKNQTFDIAVAGLDHEWLLGDKLRINQVLINLLSNAVKYTPEGGWIEFRVEELPQIVKEYSRIRFIVSDNGMGMSEEYLKIIFDPFTREDSAESHNIQGTGLGMAITKSLVDLMGGSIRVDSSLGKGSTFMVELELHIQETEDEEPAFWRDYSVSRMIVADDQEEACLHVIRAMQETGVMVDYATSGEKAIQMMRSAREAGRPYDLILLDWKMPDMNGLETARLIRKNYSQKIPILLFTAYDWKEIEKEAIGIGVNHFMPKPFFMSTFKDAIRRVMGSRKEDEANEENIVQGKQILVVDDIEVNQIILVKILSSLGANCDVAGNGQEAVQKLESAPPRTYDLILMDVQMPIMDGYEATRTIRASSSPSARDVPIIAMTANAFVDDARDAIKSGMDAHVAKPVQIDKLKETIRQVLSSREKK